MTTKTCLMLTMLVGTSLIFGMEDNTITFITADNKKIDLFSSKLNHYPLLKDLFETINDDENRPLEDISLNQYHLATKENLTTIFNIVNASSIDPVEEDLPTDWSQFDEKQKSRIIETVKKELLEKPFLSCVNIIALADFLRIDMRIQRIMADRLSEFRLEPEFLDTILENKISVPRKILFNSTWHLFKRVNIKERRYDAYFNPKKKQCIFMERLNGRSIDKASERKLVLVIKTFTQDSETEKSIKINDWRSGFAVNESKNIVAYIDKDKIFIHDLDTLERIRTIDVEAPRIFQIKFSPDGKWLVMDTDGNLVFYDTDNYLLHKAHSAVINEKIDHFCFNGEGTKIAYKVTKGAIRIYDLLSEKSESIAIDDDHEAKRWCRGMLVFNDNHSTYGHDYGRSNVVVDVDENKAYPFMYNYLFTTCDRIQDVLAFVDLKKHSSQIEYTVSENLLEKTSFAVNTFIRCLGRFAFSSDGNYITHSPFNDEYTYVDIHHVPVLSHTVAALDTKQRWFVYFCNYWQRNNISIPQQYRNLYANLPENLRIKFESICPKTLPIKSSDNAIPEELKEFAAYQPNSWLSNPLENVQLQKDFSVPCRKKTSSNEPPWLRKVGIKKIKGSREMLLSKIQKNREEVVAAQKTQWFSRTSSSNMRKKYKKKRKSTNDTIFSCNNLIGKYLLDKNSTRLL